MNVLSVNKHVRVSDTDTPSEIKSRGNISSEQVLYFLKQVHLQVRHVILLFCQFVNYLEVTRLPVYYPSQQEKDDPKLYATNVRKLMAHEVYYSLIVLKVSVFGKF